MSEGEGAFRVATAYVALVPQDEGFSEQIAAQIEEAVGAGADAAGEQLIAILSESADEAGAALAEGLGAGSEEASLSAQELYGSYRNALDGVASMAKVTSDEVVAALTAGNEEAAAQVEALMAAADTQVSVGRETGLSGAPYWAAMEELKAAQASAAAYVKSVSQQGAEAAVTAEAQVESAAKESVAQIELAAEKTMFTIEEVQARFSALMAQGTDEADAAAQALMVRYKDLIDEAGAELGQLTASVEQVAEQEMRLAEVVDLVSAAVANGSITQAQGFMAIAAGEAQATAGAEAQFKAVTALIGTWAAAKQGLEAYGTTEATAALAAAQLVEAQDELLGSNTSLVQMWQMMAQGSERDAEIIAGNLKAVADAQAALTRATQAQVAATTEMNLALIQNETTFADEAVAMRDLSSAAQFLGVSEEQLRQQLAAGQTQTLAMAAADAEATLQAQALDEAQQRLAATQLTLVAASARNAAAGGVEAEQLTVMRAAVKNATAEVEGLSGASEHAAAGMGGMGGGMGWMYAAMNLVYILPMLSGLFSSSAVSAADFTAAVSQDSNAVGSNTAAVIQQTLAKTNLSDISKQLGLSQAQLIEYAAGEADVQQQVASAYEQTTEAMAKQAQGNPKGGPESGRQAGYALHDLEQQKAALDAITTAVQQAIQDDQAQSDALLAADQTTKIYTASVDALGSKLLLNVQNTLMNNQATADFSQRVLAAMSTQQYMTEAVAAGGATMLVNQRNTVIANLATEGYTGSVMQLNMQQQALNAAIGASFATMQLQAQTAAISSVGVLNLGQNQGALNQQLVSAETAYNEAAQAGNAYNTALTALNGTTLSVDQAHVTLAQQMLNAKKSFEQNKYSLDLSTQAGINNTTALDNAATAITALGVAQYKQTGNINAANQTIQRQVTAFVNATGATGQARTAILQYLDSITQIPPNVTTTVQVDTGVAFQTLNALQYQMNELQSQGVHVAPQAVAGHRAAGGPVQAGQAYIVGEKRAEWFVPDRPGYIYPSVAEGAQALSSRGAPGAYGAPVFQFFGTQHPTGEQMAILKREFVSAMGAGV